MTHNPHRGSDALEFLKSIIPDTPENRRIQQQEAMRIELTQVLRDARKISGKTHAEIASILGKDPKWVKQAEDCNYEHSWDEFIAYLDAIGADFELTVTIGEQQIKLDTDTLKKISG